MLIEKQLYNQPKKVKVPQTTRESHTLQSLKCGMMGEKSADSVIMSVQVIGYEAGPHAANDPGDGITWICQLQNGLRVNAPLKDGFVVSAFDAMHYIGRNVELSCKSLTVSGVPLLPFISNLKQQ